MTEASTHYHAIHPAIAVSFEFFPPKTAAMEASLWNAIRKLEPLAPDFVSVTYGAGGSTRERTHATISRLLKETSLKPAAHLTCVAATKEEVDSIIRGYWEDGVRHIVALRGDPPEGAGAAYVPHPGGYCNGADLTAGIKRIADFEVSVSAYPEKHPESPTIETDLDMLQAKVDAGATRAMTQFFFNNDCYWRYLERVRARGINIPGRTGANPNPQFQAGGELRLPLRSLDSDRRGRALRGLGGRSGNDAACCGNGGGRTGHGPCRGRRHGVSLLHFEPRHSRLRHLPSARDQASRTVRRAAARNGLRINLQ